MRRPPRSKTAPILSRRLLARVGFSASLIILGVLFILARELSDGSTSERDQTMVSVASYSQGKTELTSSIRSQTFTSFVFLDLVSALQARGLNVPLITGAPNKMLLLTVSVSFVAQLSLIYFPFLQSVFHTESLSFRDLSVLVLLGAGSYTAHEVRRRYEKRTMMEEMWSEAQTV